MRELKNLVQRLLILGSGDEISLDEVEHALGARGRQTAGMPVSFDAPLRTARAEFERAYFEYQLGLVGGNIADVANRAGIERTHLYRKLRMLGIKPTRLAEANHEKSSCSAPTRVGTSVAENLSRENNDITVVDSRGACTICRSASICTVLGITSIPMCCAAPGMPT